MFPRISPWRRRCAPLLLLPVLLGWALAPRAEVEVLASIKPLQLLAQELVGERGQVSLLLEPNASPHDYPLKVSDMQRLNNADLVLWVGEELETFLSRPLARVAPENQLSLAALPDLHWPRYPEESQHPEEPGGHDHGHHHHGRDPHLWLDPRNGAKVARVLADRLATLDPDNADYYRDRAGALVSELDELDRSLEARLEPVAGRGFAVYHQAYGHFVQRYGLNQLTAVTESPERRPGARHLYELRQRLAGAACLFTEPYYDMSAARDLAQELDLRLGELDLLGASEAVTDYPGLLDTLADNVLECLQADS
ncbi:zinc ABC transporter substrate-binding protein [Marinimicrobium sp. C2-29]|uniref:zinc ABC transporter substrate-binding protein n=1 Tax=Marinimicrobium sp. C2-29 TaxID=3139825 RepID=UPI00313874DF